MARFLFKLIALAFTVGLIAGAYALKAPALLERERGPRTSLQIEEKFRQALTRDYDLLILGNSRMYRGVNPACLSLSAYNFALEEDAFNQCYYKLDYLARQGKRFRYLLLGVDYFDFSALTRTRNYAYAPYFDPAYLRDYQTPGWGAFAYMQDKNLEFDDFVARTYTHSFPAFLPALLHSLQGRPAQPAVLEPSGQLLEGAPASLGLLAKSRLVRDGRRLPIQEQYFEKTLNWARGQRIPVFLVMPPTNAWEIQRYQPGTIAANEAYLQRQVKGGGVTYLNYLRDPRFTLRDYADLAHLAPAAADRFSQILDQDLRQNLP